MKKYVLVDMKPQNMLVTPEGKVSIIDMDSIQIHEQGTVIFHGPLATPEYVPPEGMKLNPAKDYIPASWDAFSLSVIFYQILIGVHPFAASSSGKFNQSTTISDKIHQGLFPFGSKASFMEQIPDPHLGFFKVLPYKVRNLFFDAFEKGHIRPEARPSPEKWGETIFDSINSGELTNSGTTALALVKPKTLIQPSATLVAQEVPSPTQNISSIQEQLLVLEGYRNCTTFGSSGFRNL